MRTTTKRIAAVVHCHGIRPAHGRCFLSHCGVCLTILANEQDVCSKYRVTGIVKTVLGIGAPGHRQIHQDSPGVPGGCRNRGPVLNTFRRADAGTRLAVMWPTGWRPTPVIKFGSFAFVQRSTCSASGCWTSDDAHHGSLRRPGSRSRSVEHLRAWQPARDLALSRPRSARRSPPERPKLSAVGREVAEDTRFELVRA